MSHRINIRYFPLGQGLSILIWHNKILTMWKFKYHTTHFVTAGFGEYCISLVFITSSLLWAVATVAVRYSTTTPHKYVKFTQRIHIRILPAFDIWMFNTLQLFLWISNYPHSMLLTSAHYCPQKWPIYVTLNWTGPLYVTG